MITLEGCLVWIITMTADGSILYLFSSVVLGSRVTWRRWLGYLAVILPLDALSMAVTEGDFSGWSLLLGLTELIVLSLAVFRRRGDGHRRGGDAVREHDAVAALRGGCPCC